MGRDKTNKKHLESSWVSPPLDRSIIQRVSIEINCHWNMLLKVVWKYHSLVEPSATQIAVKVFPKKTSFVCSAGLIGILYNLYSSRNRCNAQRYWAVTIAQRQTLGFGCGTWCWIPPQAHRLRLLVPMFELLPIQYVFKHYWCAAS